MSRESIIDSRGLSSNSHSKRTTPSNFKFKCNFAGPFWPVSQRMGTDFVSRSVQGHILPPLLMFQRFGDQKGQRVGCGWPLGSPMKSIKYFISEVYTFGAWPLYRQGTGYICRYWLYWDKFWIFNSTYYNIGVVGPVYLKINLKIL